MTTVCPICTTVGVLNGTATITMRTMVTMPAAVTVDSRDADLITIQTFEHTEKCYL